MSQRLSTPLPGTPKAEVPDLTPNTAAVNEELILAFDSPYSTMSPEKAGVGSPIRGESMEAPLLRPEAELLFSGGANSAAAVRDGKEAAGDDSNQEWCSACAIA